MPLPAARKDGDKERSARSQEQELKRARGAISCAECRRLKLKCDKTVPCGSCKRRGCASICPNGSLTTGQGTRFILADTDRLHRKIAEMSDRIRQLEDGLAILQSSVARDPHPLLNPDLLKIKSGLELHSAAEGLAFDYGKEREQEDEEEPAYIDAFGTLAVRDDGAATFYGRSAGSESLLLDEKPTLSISTLSRPTTGHPELHEDINRLAASFPHGLPEIPILDLQDIIQSYLPPWPRARELRDLYLEQAPWFFGAVTQRQLYDEVFPLFYEEAAEESRSRVANGLVGSADAFNLPHQSTPQASSHELGLMLVVFCYGALTDPNLLPAPHNKEAQKYYQLTRAALSLEPVMDRPPSVATVQVLALMAIYQGMVADEHSIETTWALMGLSSKLAQSTGLHRDSSRFKLSAAETQKRRALFWELFITDCWQALATGRLPTFELQFVDTELPADPDETLAEDGTPQPSFPAWKARWGKECVYNVVMSTLTASPPKYSAILELDRRLRDMPLPKYAQGPPPQNCGLAQTMSHYMPINYLHLTLLYVHRCFFASALNDHPTDPLRSQYAPSFLAGYRSASALLMTIREQFALFPTQIARFWVVWTHAFSACVMMGSVVTRGGTTKNAQAALGELHMACDLFERAAQHGGRACKFVPILRKLYEKAKAAYFQGLQPLRRDIFAPRTSENEQDELSIFSGRTPRTVATKSNRPPRVSPSTSSSSVAITPDDHSSPNGSQNGSDQRHSQSPGTEAFPGLDSSFRTAVHPGLVAEFRTFEGQLDAQIDQTNSYYAQNAPDQQAQHPQYAEQFQAPQQLQQDHSAWYAVNAEHAQHASPPSTGSSQQPQQEAYSIQYSHPQAHPHSQAPSQEHPSEHQYQSHYTDAVPTASSTNEAYAHAHDIPVYGGAYSKAPAPAGAPSYAEHPYAHVAAANEYAAYGSVPDQRSELWAVNVPAHAPHEEGPASAVYHAPQEGYDPRGVVDPAGAGQSHAHGHGHHLQSHPHPQVHPHAHSQVHPHSQAHPHSHPHTHPHTHEAGLPSVHVQYQPAPSAQQQPQPIQPQLTGHGQVHMQQAQYAQQQYGYGQEQDLHAQQHYQQQQQQQQPLQPQHSGFVQPPNGYSLQETWTTFFQSELPGGGRR